MRNSINQLFTVTLFSLATILSTGYIETVQATKQEVAEKKILQDKLLAIAQAQVRDGVKFITLVLSEKGKAKVQLEKKLDKCLQFAFKEYKKYLSILSLAELQLIVSKEETLESMRQEFMVRQQEMIQDAFMLLGKMKNELEPPNEPDDPSQKAVLDELKLEFQEITKLLQVSYEHQQHYAMLSPNDLEKVHSYRVAIFQEQEKALLDSPYIVQQCFLPSIKKTKEFLERVSKIEEELVLAIPDTLKKKLQELGKKISQQIHVMLDAPIKADTSRK